MAGVAVQALCVGVWADEGSRGWVVVGRVADREEKAWGDQITPDGKTGTHRPGKKGHLCAVAL